MELLLYSVIQVFTRYKSGWAGWLKRFFVGKVTSPGELMLLLGHKFLNHPNVNPMVDISYINLFPSKKKEDIKDLFIKYRIFIKGPYLI